MYPLITVRDILDIGRQPNAACTSKLLNLCLRKAIALLYRSVTCSDKVCHLEVYLTDEARS